MSGGNKNRQRGCMSSSVQQDTSELDPRKLRDDEERLAALDERVNHLRGEQVNLENSVTCVFAAKDYSRRQDDVEEAHHRVEEFDRTSADFESFNTITAKLKEMYQMIMLGGDAELELVDSLDAFTEGITFSVRPPNKSWKNISNLSGGEKTLSILALVFALHYYKPTPLYVMDEIDAALDFKNVSIVANYIKVTDRNFTRNTPTY